LRLWTPPLITKIVSPVSFGHQAVAVEQEGFAATIVVSPG